MHISLQVLDTRVHARVRCMVFGSRGGQVVLDPSDGVISCGENDVLVERDGVAWIIFFWMLHPEAVATILGPYWFTDCNDCNVFNIQS